MSKIKTSNSKINTNNSSTNNSNNSSNSKSNTSYKSVLHELIGTDDTIEVIFVTILVILWFIIVICLVKLQLSPPVFKNVSKDTNEGFSNYEKVSRFNKLKPMGIRQLPNEFKPGLDSLFIFKNNQVKPECCDSSYGSNTGCVCTTAEQRDFINKRGGNRTVEHRM